MKISDAARDQLVKKYEGLRLTAYKPIPGDPWTIGYGHTLGVSEGDVWTKEQADAQLDEVLAELSEEVEDLVGDYSLTQNQLDALVDFSYNLGLQSLATSTLLKKLRNGDVRGASNEFGRWVYAHGDILNGLITRRAAEREWFLRGA